MTPFTVTSCHDSSSNTGHNQTGSSSSRTAGQQYRTNCVTAVVVPNIQSPTTPSASPTTFATSTASATTATIVYTATTATPNAAPTVQSNQQQYPRPSTNPPLQEERRTTTTTTNRRHHTQNNHTNNTGQNVHNSSLSPICRVFTYTSEHPTNNNQAHRAVPTEGLVNMADFGGLERTTIIIQVQNMAFERNPSFESDLADVLEALFSLPATDSYTGESTGKPAIIQLMHVSLPEEDKSLMDMLVGKWTVEVLTQEAAFVRVSVRPPLGLGRRAKQFFTKGCGIHSESSATAPLIMMDRHQFYIPFNNSMCHAAVRQYSEEIRKAAQASRHLYTDRLPSRPLKIKFEACKEGMDFLTDYPQL